MSWVLQFLLHSQTCLMIESVSVVKEMPLSFRFFFSNVKYGCCLSYQLFSWVASITELASFTHKHSLLTSVSLDRICSVL